MELQSSGTCVLGRRQTLANPSRRRHCCLEPTSINTLHVEFVATAAVARSPHGMTRSARSTVNVSNQINADCYRYAPANAKLCVRAERLTGLLKHFEIQP